MFGRKGVLWALSMRVNKVQNDKSGRKRAPRITPKNLKKAHNKENERNGENGKL